MDGFFREINLTTDQAQIFAAGLFNLAQVGGVAEEERQIIERYYRETNLDAELPSEKTLAEFGFDWERLAQALPDHAHRRFFLRACILLAYSDGHYSVDERFWIENGAIRLGQEDALVALHESVKQYLLSQLIEQGQGADLLEKARLVLGLPND